MDLKYLCRLRLFDIGCLFREIMVESEKMVICNDSST